MAKQYRKLITLIIILLAIPYPAWYGVNWYFAGLVDQTALIEFGYEDDFVYCQKWRPELYDKTSLIPTPELYDKTNLVPIRGADYLPLSWASRYNKHKLFNLLLNIEEIDKLNSYGSSAIHTISFNNNLKHLNQIIDKGASLEIKTKGGFTPLLLACGEGNTEILKLLILKGADINAVNNFKANGLLMTAHTNNLFIAKILLENNIDLEQNDFEGYSAMQQVCLAGNIEFLKLLIKKGVEVNAVNYGNKTALDLAKTEDIKELLIQHGAKTAEQLNNKISELDD